MHADPLTQPCLPSTSKIRSHVLRALSRYWPVDCSVIDRLPLKVCQPHGAIHTPLRLQPVWMPTWSAACAVDGYLLVPTETLPLFGKDLRDAWKSVDWILAAFLLLEGWHERIWEHQYGPIHSYNLHLSGWDQRAFQHAWVNRIGLFLRQWAIHHSGPAAEQHMGSLPSAEILITHDVDALYKSLPIRLKQGAFNLFNAVRALRYGQLTTACKSLSQANRFLLSRDDWWVFDRLIMQEREAGIKAIYHFHSDPRPKTPKRWLFDPSYSTYELSHCNLLKQLSQDGHAIGLHPGFDTWNSTEKIASARQHLEQATGSSVDCVRQHWLRFSWRDTWTSQASAGLKHDTTLMFNDRPGYRTSSALAWQPWNPISNSAHPLTALPTVLMDSHFYDYHQMTPDQRRQSIQHWIRECQTVHGTVAVLWHPHTLSQDYGWSEGFNDTLASLKSNLI